MLTILETATTVYQGSLITDHKWNSCLFSSVSLLMYIQTVSEI